MRNPMFIRKTGEIVFKFAGPTANGVADLVLQSFLSYRPGVSQLDLSS